MRDLPTPLGGRVLEAAQALGYRFVRRGTKTVPGGQSTIVFVADETSTDPWMSLAFEGARDKALEYGINVLMAVSHGDADVETNIVAGLGKLPILGLIYGTILTRLVQIPAALADRRIVLVNCYDEHREHHSVLPGDLLGGRTATEHLLLSVAGGSALSMVNREWTPRVIASKATSRRWPATISSSILLWCVRAIGSHRRVTK